MLTNDDIPKYLKGDITFWRSVTRIYKTYRHILRPNNCNACFICIINFAQKNFNSLIPPRLLLCKDITMSKYCINTLLKANLHKMQIKLNFLCVLQC